MQDFRAQPTPQIPQLRAASIDFASIPGQSKLFLEYQSDPLSLQDYFPSAVASHADISGRVGEVLAAYTTDREVLCNTLQSQNRKFAATARTFEHIELLRQADTVAVVTGQQTGLFTGPLYTVYKALSAIRFAECLRERGTRAVPVFWAASEDHDFEEISRAIVLANGTPSTFKLTAETDAPLPVGAIPIDENFGRELKRLAIDLSGMSRGAEAIAQVAAVWKPGRSIAEAFAIHLQQLFAGHGLIVVDPLDAGLKRLTSPICVRAVEMADEIVRAIVARSEQLVAAGYHAQVQVTREYFPFFYHDDDGARRAIRRRDGEVYRVNDSNLNFSLAEISRIAADEPERLSPGVMLRSVVQDHLFPTICYFGGGAEIAYFAQNSEAYRLLGRPVTTILHRQSLTIVDAKAERILDKFQFDFADLFAGFEALLPKVVERFVNPSTARTFADSAREIDSKLHRLDQELSQIDPTLADNLATRRRKILYHINALRSKFHRVQLERDGTVRRQLRWLFDSLLPAGGLQERSLNATGFAARYGPSFVDLIYRSLDLEERGHRVIYLK